MRYSAAIVNTHNGFFGLTEWRQVLHKINNMHYTYCGWPVYEYINDPRTFQGNLCNYCFK